MKNFRILGQPLGEKQPKEKREEEREKTPLIVDTLFRAAHPRPKLMHNIGSYEFFHAVAMFSGHWELQYISTFQYISKSTIDEKDDISSFFT